jgi:hypothetical protein
VQAAAATLGTLKISFPEYVTPILTDVSAYLMKETLLQVKC